MKNIFTFFVFTILFLLYANDSFAGNSDTLSKKFPKTYNYGERILRIDYSGDNFFETYLLIPYEDGHNAVRSGVGYDVSHQDIDSKEFKIISSFIGIRTRLIKKALREKRSFTIKFTEKIGETTGEWVVVKDNEVFLY